MRMLAFLKTQDAVFPLSVSLERTCRKGDLSPGEEKKINVDAWKGFFFLVEVH